MFFLLVYRLWGPGGGNGRGLVKEAKWLTSFLSLSSEPLQSHLRNAFSYLEMNPKFPLPTRFRASRVTRRVRKSEHLALLLTLPLVTGDNAAYLGGHRRSHLSKDSSWSIPRVLERVKEDNEYKALCQLPINCKTS